MNNKGFSAKPRVVLVIDDEPVSILVMEQCLKTAGFVLFTGTSFDEGYAIFNAHQDEIELLLTDISLPGRTGLDLARECLWKNPELKILFVSAWSGEFYGIPKSDLHFLPKPFRSLVLVQRVEEVLRSTGEMPWLWQRASSEGAVQ